MSMNLVVIAQEAEREKIEKKCKAASFFDSILGQLTNKGYILAQFLNYVFNLANTLNGNFRWNGFFKNCAVMCQILDNWISS